MRTSLAVVASLLLCALAGCSGPKSAAPPTSDAGGTQSEPATEVADAPEELPAASIARVRVIPYSGWCSVGANRTLVCEVFEEGASPVQVYDPWTCEQPTTIGDAVLPSGTGTPYSELGPSNPSATGDGVYFDANGRLYYQAYDAPAARDTGYSDVERAWASPSGRIVLVERGGTEGRDYYYAFVRPFSNEPEVPWTPKGGMVGDAVWTDDDALLVEVDDSPPDGGWGSVYSLRISASGEIDESKAAAMRMSCPAPNPAMDVWAYPGDGGLAFCRPGRPEESESVWPATWAEVAHPDPWMFVWIDATHLVVSVNDRSEGTTSLWVLDCENALAEFDSKP